MGLHLTGIKAIRTHILLYVYRRVCGGGYNILVLYGFEVYFYRPFSLKLSKGFPIPYNFLVYFHESDISYNS